MNNEPLEWGLAMAGPPPAEIKFMQWLEGLVKTEQSSVYNPETGSTSSL